MAREILLCRNCRKELREIYTFWTNFNLDIPEKSTKVSPGMIGYFKKTGLLVRVRKLLAPDRLVYFL